MAGVPRSFFVLIISQGEKVKKTFLEYLQRVRQCYNKVYVKFFTRDNKCFESIDISVYNVF